MTRTNRQHRMTTCFRISEPDESDPFATADRRASIMFLLQVSAKLGTGGGLKDHQIRNRLNTFPKR
jgi:hypothetical protein